MHFKPVLTLLFPFTRTVRFGLHLPFPSVLYDSFHASIVGRF